jgi:hypothetical protein
MRCPAEIIGKTGIFNRDLASGGRAFYEQCCTGEGRVAKQ